MRACLSLRLDRVILLLGLLVASPTVASADRPDAWITMKTKVALLTAEGISASAIDVDTVDGTITLHGKVATEAEKTKAESVARKIDGAKGVRNLLQVVPSHRKEVVKSTDSDVKERLVKTLEADKSFEGIKVASVNNGVVLLSGKAALAPTLRAVETIARRPSFPTRKGKRAANHPDGPAVKKPELVRAGSPHPGE